MKKLLFALAGLALTATSAIAAPPAPTAPVFTHDKALESARYLARQKVFAAECPFSDAVKSSLDRLESLVIPAIGLAPAELDSVSKSARTAALELISDSKVKSMTCPLLEAALRRQTEPEPKKLSEPPATGNK